jgi:single-strand DNA-binding protein
MPNYNRIILAGHLTRDPELRYTPKGMALAAFGLAVNRHWTAESGQKKEDVCFVDCTAWGKSAEALSKYTSKGSALLIEGSLRFETWQKDDETRSKHSVTVESFQFLGPNKGENGPAQSKPARGAGAGGTVKPNSSAGGKAVRP